MTMPGLLVLFRVPRVGPAESLGLDPQRVAALGELVGVEQIGHLVWLEHRQAQEFVGRGGGQLVIRWRWLPKRA